MKRHAAGAIIFILITCVNSTFLTSPTHEVPLPAPGSVPLIVVVDPGHGGSDSGAVGFENLKEKDITLSIARLVQLLGASDPALRIVLTRESDRSVSHVERTALANRLGVALYLSIQVNAFHRSSRIHGIETLVPTEHDRVLAERDMALAKTVHGIFVNQLGAADRGIHGQLLYLHRAQMPAVLVETGFITNPTDAQQLGDVVLPKKGCHDPNGGDQGISAHVAGRSGFLLRQAVAVTECCSP